MADYHVLPNKTSQLTQAKEDNHDDNWLSYVLLEVKDSMSQKTPLSCFYHISLPPITPNNKKLMATNSLQTLNLKIINENKVNKTVTVFAL